MKTVNGFVARSARSVILGLVAAVTVATPALAAEPLDGGTAIAAGPGIPRAWQASHGESTASGTILSIPDPLGVTTRHTVRGVVSPAAGAGCAHLDFRGTIAVTGDSTASCDPENTKPFTVRFQTVLSSRVRAAVRVCSGIEESIDCGSWTNLG